MPSKRTAPVLLNEQIHIELDRISRRVATLDKLRTLRAPEFLVSRAAKLLHKAEHRLARLNVRAGSN